MSVPSLILFYSAEGGSMSSFEFRVVERVPYRVVASDPRASYRFRQQVSEAGLTITSARSNSPAVLPTETLEASDQLNSGQEAKNVQS